MACGGMSAARGGTEEAAVRVWREVCVVGLNGTAREFFNVLGECKAPVATASLGRTVDGLTRLSVTEGDDTSPAAVGVTDADVPPTSAADRDFSHRPMDKATITHTAATTH